MPNVLDRILSTGREIFDRVSAAGTYSGSSGLMNGGNATPLGIANAPTEYELRDLMLSGDIYRPTSAVAGVTAGGGGLKWVLRGLNRPCNAQDEGKWAIPGYYNPVPQIVGFYANTLYGHWGTELRPVDPDRKEDIPTALADPLARLWRWSRLDSRKDELTALAANQGTVGIRVVTDAGMDGVTPRIYLDFDDPRFITRVIQDGRGNVLAAILHYTEVFYDERGNRADRQIQEVISKWGFSKQVGTYNDNRIFAGGEELLTPKQQENPLGVCPYVLLRHSRRNGQVFGTHAYSGTERAIWGIDLGLSQLDESVIDHLWPTWFMTGAGPKPEPKKTGKYRLIYVKTERDVPPPSAEAMVPTINIADTIAQIQQNDAFVRERNPAMILSSLKLLSGISGETLQQVLKPAESECQRARAEYETALIAALQIGLSLGVVKGMWDLGTGTGSQQAADAAYDDGQGPEAFVFADRPAIPPTVSQQVAQAAADEAKKQAKLKTAQMASVAGFDQQSVLEHAGKTPAEAKEIKRRKAQEDVAVETEQ
jgi:hypothetical protein